MSDLIILMSCLNANVEELVRNSKISSDLIVVNQCNNDSEYTLDYEGYKVYVIESKSRGLSKSRNIALRKSFTLHHDTIMLTDDDVVFLDLYKDVILQSYADNPDADLIAFDYYKNDDAVSINKIDTNQRNRISLVRNPKKYFSSVRITFRKQFIEENKIFFNEYFGAGSGQISHGEDSIFVNEIRKNKGRIYQSNLKLIIVDFTVSTWRNITNKKFFNDKGAVWKVLSPLLYPLFGFVLVGRIAPQLKANRFRSYIDFIEGAQNYKNLKRD